MGDFLPDEEVEEGDASSDGDDTVFDTSAVTYESPFGNGENPEETMRLIEAMQRNKQIEIEGF